MQTFSISLQGHHMRCKVSYFTGQWCVCLATQQRKFFGIASSAQSAVKAGKALVEFHYSHISFLLILLIVYREMVVLSQNESINLRVVSFPIGIAMQHIQVSRVARETTSSLAASWQLMKVVGDLAGTPLARWDMGYLNTQTASNLTCTQLYDYCN